MTEPRTIPNASGTRTPGACADCLRRSWLLEQVSAGLDYRWRDRERLIGLLALEDQQLLQALGGRRRPELKGRYAELDPRGLAPARPYEAVCYHDPRYPRALTGKEAPRMLFLAGGVERLRELTTAPLVAIVGSRRASDYGMEMAKSLARGLVVSGVGVTSGLSDGISVAAHTGALEVSGDTLAVMPGGLNVACPAKRRTLYERVKLSGCVVAELPNDCPPRRWGQLASERIIVGLSELTVVVEAEERPDALASACIARDLGRKVAAVPGRVTSPLSRGTHALLIGGAELVRGPEDVLELLCAEQNPTARAPLEPRLQQVLERVGAGEDTPDRLAGSAPYTGEVLLALSELEVMGLLARGDGGRYVPRDPSRGLADAGATASGSAAVRP